MTKNLCLIKNKHNKQDITGYGAVDYNFLMQQNFISTQEYVDFLNSISPLVSKYNIYTYDISNIIINENKVYKIHPEADPYQPITYINFQDLQKYCSWLNCQSLKTLDEILQENKSTYVRNLDDEFWIPSYNEWYKAAYYNFKNQSYWCFPNGSDQPPEDDDLIVNTASDYGVINAGFKFYHILWDSTCKNKEYQIAGGSFNRNKLNAKSGTKHTVSEKYRSNYISARLCKKSDTKSLTLVLHDTYGDGWQNNYLLITDANHKPLADKITLGDGYGPMYFNIDVDLIERYINIKYIAETKNAYENYYEVYDTDTQACLYKSTLYEKPPDNIIIKIQ